MRVRARESSCDDLIAIPSIYFISKGKCETIRFLLSPNRELNLRNLWENKMEGVVSTKPDRLSQFARHFDLERK